MEALSLALAGVLFAAYFAAEPLLRRARARSLGTTRFEHGTTLLVTSLGLASVVASLAARLFVDHGRFAAAPSLVACLGLAMLAAVALRFWAMRTLGEFFTRTLTLLPDQHLVVAGPYRVVRHPGYLAQIAVLVAGSALVSLNVWVVSAVGPLLLAAYAYRIRAEERMLESRFGEAYRGYRARTWRLIPGLY